VRPSTLNDHMGQVWSVKFSPDGSRIASSWDDNTVRIWDARTGVHLRTLKAHQTRRSDANKWYSSTWAANTPVSGLASYEIHLKSADWLVVESGHIHTRFWLPTGTFSSYYNHSSHGTSVVVGTDKGFVVLLEMPSTVVS